MADKSARIPLVLTVTFVAASAGAFARGLAIDNPSRYNDGAGNWLILSGFLAVAAAVAGCVAMTRMTWPRGGAIQALGVGACGLMVATAIVYLVMAWFWAFLSSGGASG